MVFCSQEEIDNNARFALLKLRRVKAPEFRNYRMIPINEKEIPRQMLDKKYDIWFSQIGITPKYLFFIGPLSLASITLSYPGILYDRDPDSIWTGFELR